MRKLVVLGALLLCGCAPTAEQQLREKLAQQDADDAKCRSTGAKPGEAAYVECRAQLDAARTQAEATTVIAHEAAAPAPALRR